MTPLFASERTAAHLLDMPPADFRRLVADGALPPPVRIGKHERWPVEALARIGGKAAWNPDEGMEA